jgi:hypothetical protein
MRFKTLATLVFVTSLGVFAGAGGAQGQAQNPPVPPPPAQSGQGQQQPMSPATIGGGMMTPEMMQMMGPMLSRSQNVRMRGGAEAEGPLQGISRLMKAIDDPQVRATVGITDEQADSLRKIVVDTETFTITTVANMAVDSIQLRELLRADKPDKAAVMSKGDEISKDTSLLIHRYLDAMLSAKTILTPEQQKKLRAYVESGAPAVPVIAAHP